MAKLSACVFIMLVLLTALNERALAKSCCTRYQSHPFPVDRLKDYRVQEDTGSCNIRAIIFLTVKGRVFCANPKQQWVIEAVETLKKRKH